MDDLYCIGCGIKLQSEDEKKEGYVNPNAFNRSFVLCKRCYQLKHYGKFVESKEVKNTIQLLHKNASKNDLIVLISDFSFVYTPLIKVLQELNRYENLIFIGNRYDLYNDYLSIEKAYRYVEKEIKKAKIRFHKIWIVNNNIEEIFDYIDNHSVDKDIYLVGLENAGKTSFINLILKNIANEQKNFLTHSKYPGTTVDLIKIPFAENHYLIDSPGIHSKGNIFHFLEREFIFKLQNDVKIKPIIFQLNEGQSLLISNILKFDYLSGEKQSILFYGSSRLEVMRCKYENSILTFNHRMKDLKLKSNKVTSYANLYKRKIVIDKNEKMDIVIEGLGFFTVKKGVYFISTFQDVNLFVRDSMI